MSPGSIYVDYSIYLKSKMIITPTSKAEIKTWAYIEGQKRVGIENTISTSARPYNITVNNDETQLLYLVAAPIRKHLETYSFRTKHQTAIHLPDEMKTGNSLIPMRSNEVLTGDLESGNICILRSESIQQKQL